MAARRLVIVMLVLLAISTLVAALLPPPDQESAPPPPHAGRHRHQPADQVPGPGKLGQLLVARMQVSGRMPKTVRVERGDELRLSVAAPFGDDIEIPALGRTAAVTPSAPAAFDLLATDIGSFEVRAVHSGRMAGSLLVGRPGTGRCGVSTPAALPGRASARSCARRGRPASAGHGRSAPRP